MAKSIAMALTITVIIQCISRIGKSGYSFLIACLCVLMTPRLIARQAIVWTAGFSNYSTSVALCMIFLVFAIYNPTVADRRKRLLLFAGLLVLGVAGTLIVEHVTLYSLVLATGLTVFSLFKDKRHIPEYLSYLAGTAIGTLIMFSNSVYYNVAAGNDDYRSVAASQSLLDRIKDNYFGSIYYDGFFNNIFLNSILLIAMVLLYRKACVNNRYKTNTGKIAGLSLIVFCGFVIYSVFMRLSFNASDIPEQVIKINALLAFIGLIAFTSFFLISGYVMDDFRRTFLIAASIFIVIAPLFLVTPIGSRCFFVSYVFMTAALCVMIDYITQDEPELTLRKILLTLCITVYVAYLAIFAVIFTSNNSRLESIRRAANEGEKEAKFTVLPFDSMLWTATPTEGIWQDRYKLFYGLPEDLHIEIKERK